MLNMDSYRSLLYTLLIADGACTGPVLARAAGVSLKTLRKNIKEINELLEPRQIHIESKTGVGYTVVYKDALFYRNLREEIVNQYLRSQFYSSSQRNRVHYILRRLLSTDAESIDTLAAEMFYSDSAIARDIKYVKQTFRMFDITVSQNTARGLTLHASEWNIRMCMIYLLDQGIEITELNLGNRPDKGKDTRIAKHFCVGAHEVETIRALSERGVHVTCQLVPAEACCEALDLLKKAGV